MNNVIIMLNVFYYFVDDDEGCKTIIPKNVKLK